MDSDSITPTYAHSRNLKERVRNFVVVRNLLVVVVSLGMMEGRKDFENELNKRPCHEGARRERGRRHRKERRRSRLRFVYAANAAAAAAAAVDDASEGAEGTFSRHCRPRSIAVAGRRRGGEREADRQEGPE